MNLFNSLFQFIKIHQESLIIGVIASLVAILLQIITTVISNTITYFVTSRIRLKRLFSFKEKNHIYVVSGSVNQSDHQDVAFLAGPDATAAESMVQTLRIIYTDSFIKHYYATKQYLAILNENIVTVGGPVFNSCTKQMLKNLTKDIYYDEDDRLHFFNQIYSKSKEEDLDYGLIIRHRNPYSPDKKVIILAGCGSHGVLASSVLFEKNKRFNDLYKSFKKNRGFIANISNKDFYAIIKCHITGNEVSNMIIENLKLVTKGDEND